MSTSSRLLTLLSLLQGRRDWPGGELAARLEVSPRTVRRDVERLRALGYPVQSLPGPAGGYRLRAGSAMPPLLLDDEEAVAIAVGLGTAARASVDGVEEAAIRALVKLEQVLPPHLRSRVGAIGEVTSVASVGGPTVDPECLTTLAAGCRDAEVVRFAYCGRDGTQTRREVEPHALVNIGRRWYLLAWDRRRDDWRTFRADRIAEPQPVATRFTPRELPGKDAAAYVADNLASAPHQFEARAVVDAPVEVVRERLPYAWGSAEPRPDGRTDYRTGDDNLDWLAMRLLMLGLDFELEGPPELADHLRELGRRMDRAAAAVS